MLNLGDQGGEAGYILVADRIAFLTQTRKHGLQVEGIPGGNNIDHQPRRLEMVLLPFSVMPAQFASIVRLGGL
jgi:hypothetical protein